MVDVIFIGGVGEPHKFGGELSKNKLIIQSLKDAGYKVKVIDTYRSHSNPLKVLGLPYYVVRHSSRPIIFSTRYTNIRPFARFVRMVNRKRPIIFFPIGGRLGRKIKNGIISPHELSIFNRIVVESPKIVQQLHEAGVKTAEYLPNFKDGSLFAPNKSKTKYVGEELKCVFVSRIQPEKGTDIILDAIERANKSGRKITVDFYGEIIGDYKEEFLPRVEKMSNVRYCGFLNFFDGSGQEKLSRYHLFLFPTYWEGEGFPGAVIDAYMAGVPVLASDWMFNSEFISEKTGFLCKPRDNEDFTSKLIEIYDNRETLPSYVENCISVGKKYDVKKLLTRDYFESLFHKRK